LFLTQFFELNHFSLAFRAYWTVVVQDNSVSSES
jgi:hypothetical protein